MGFEVVAAAQRMKKRNLNLLAVQRGDLAGLADFQQLGPVAQMAHGSTRTGFTLHRESSITGTDRPPP